MNRPLIIAHAPTREGLILFGGKKGSRLSLLAGLGNNGDILTQYFEMYNLGEKGAYCRERVQALIGHLDRTLDNKTLLYMGHKTRRTMSGTGHDYLEWFPIFDGKHQAINFPHPLENNPWWSNSNNQDQASDLLRSLIW